MKPIKHRLSDSHDEWLRQRNKGIGGSDAGAAMGLNKWESPFTLWAEKTGLLEPDNRDSESMRQGRDFEGYVAKRFCEETGKRVRRSGYSFQSEEHPWMLANIDRKVVGENAGLECKTANIFADDSYMKGDIPMHYYCQCLHYMAVCGFDRMYLATLIFGRNFHVFTIDRSDPGVEDDIQALIESEKAFWELVESKTPPEVDGSDSTQDTLKQLNHADSSTPVVDLQGFESLLDERSELKASIDEMKDRVSTIENLIRADLGSSETGRSESYNVTWKAATRTMFDSKALKKDHPNLYDQYSSQAETRTLRITKKKEKKSK